jgi:hypothetical protein
MQRKRRGMQRRVCMEEEAKMLWERCIDIYTTLYNIYT